MDSPFTPATSRYLRHARIAQARQCKISNENQTKDLLDLLPEKAHAQRDMVIFRRDMINRDLDLLIALIRSQL